MPWVKDTNGQDIYKDPAFTANELPTWDEIYNEFLKNGKYDYDPHKDRNDIQYYWNIPHRLYMVAMMVNQFNKELHENYKYPILVKILNEFRENDDTLGNIINVYFTLHPMAYMKDNKLGWFASDDPARDRFMVYAMQPPNRVPDPFVANRPRLSINRLTDQKVIIRIVIDDDHGKLQCYELHENDMLTQKIIDALLSEIKMYYTNGIGWKDENGNLAVKYQSSNNCPSGYDPAL